ncbi:MAG: glycosyltransferase [Acidobacteriota bacterium]|nr:glycosyltransferase [Acidobacteriota bacterium]
MIDECLRALEDQRGDFDAEIIVVSCCGNSTSEHIKRNFPRVKLIQLSERLGIPQLRAVGMSHATGDIIAITEDCCIPCENWFEEIIKAHRSGYDAVGGPIENGSTNRILNWAVYLCEYSYMMLPITYSEVSSIAGNNSSYKRETLDMVDESIKRDYWEFFLHQELRKLDVKFLTVPAIVVVKKKEFTFLYFLTQRFHFSRSFAGMRSRLISPSRRAISALFSPALPFLMTWRIAQQVFQKKRYYKEFLLSLPLLAIFMVSYAAGEFTGYVFGSGKSLEKVE